MNQVVDCDLFQEADDSCLVYQHKDVKKLSKNVFPISLIRSGCRL